MIALGQEKKDCTGCTACLASCPVKCIEMEADEEGFLYPKIDSNKCIQCGKCRRICPQMKNDKKCAVTIMKKQQYAVVTKDRGVWKKSASGGAFSEICRGWGKDHEVLIAGAVWNGWRVQHSCVYRYSEIEPLRKSKYIASSMEHTYETIKDHLEKGGKAVFSGTPCQVSGLKCFLNRDYPGLLLIDLICHGVGSPVVFESCLQAMERQFDTRIIGYQFRAKRQVFETEYLSRITVADHNGKEKNLYLLNDQYNQLFLSQNCLRPSCGENCKYRTEDREGDITIADFKGLTQVFPQLLGTKQNFSAVIINTEKGAKAFEGCKQGMSVLPCELEDIKNHNPLFYRNTWFSDKRDQFFQEFVTDKAGTIERWTKSAKVSKRTLMNCVYGLMPVVIRKKIRQARK